MEDNHEKNDSYAGYGERAGDGKWVKKKGRLQKCIIK